MNNIVNYLNHITVDPSYYQRNYKNDLPSEETTGWLSVAERAALIVIPFLSLYKPFGKSISLVMSSCRCITHLFQAGKTRHIAPAIAYLSLAGLSAIALASTILNFTLGLIVTTAADSVMSGVSFIQHVINKEYTKAFEDFLQLLSCAFYLLILASGNLEIILISLLFQALFSFYQARHEFAAGKYPEWAAKLLMGMVRCYQAKGTLDQIQKRNFLFSLIQFNEMRKRAENAKKAFHLIDSPLNDMKGQIQEHTVILSDAQDQEYNFGAYLHGHGKGVVKGANLNLGTSVIDGKEMTQIEFKINHVFRDALETAIQNIKPLPQEDLANVLAFSHAHVKGIKVETIPMNLFSEKPFGNAYKIDFEGLGSLSVGASIDYPTLYDKVTVNLNPGKNLYDLHELLSFVNLNDVIRKSTPDDIERLKIGHLFRTIFPKEAFPLERSEDFFNLPLNALKTEMISRAPDMESIFQETLPSMQPLEIFPGKVRYSVPGLTEKARSLGASMLTSGLSGKAYSQQEMFDQTASILKMGMLSSETRFSNGMFISGTSSKLDFFLGSADSVFTQMVTQKNYELGQPFKHLPYRADIRFLFSLDLLETGTYQYTSDTFGERKPQATYSSYPERPGILDFTKACNEHTLSSNEVMIKERIPPSMIQGIVVRDQKTRTQLIEHLKMRNLVQKDETILGIALNDFILVS
ncbi:MAG: hypothetical protein V4494_08265 [Chlamydiota bacterium]